MHKVHLVNGHVVYVYWIDTVYVQNNLPTELATPAAPDIGLRIVEKYHTTAIYIHIA